MAKKMYDVNGFEIRRRFRTDVWMDLRTAEPTPSHIARPGFPKQEEGSIDRASKTIMRGLAAKIACYDRMEGKYIWTVIRGPKVRGTRIHQANVVKGEA